MKKQLKSIIFYNFLYFTTTDTYTFGMYEDEEMEEKALKVLNELKNIKEESFSKNKLKKLKKKIKDAKIYDNIDDELYF